MSNTNILILGAGGQIGTDLVAALRELHGAESVISADLKKTCPDALAGGPYIRLDVLDRSALSRAIHDHKIGVVYHLVAMLSATAEKDPVRAWNLNMNSLFNVLELAREGHIDQVFWPSSIAVFGPRSPHEATPQHTVYEPTTVYGISKVAGESWCAYYHDKFGVDVRSVRYPGIISHKAEPGGGTTDYAVHIYHEAIKHGHYASFIQANRKLPMMYMPDAIRATLAIMAAPAEKIQLRAGYNIGAMSFSPEQLGASVRKFLPDFTLSYDLDHRNEIASHWPASVDDSAARADWGWQPEYDIDRMSEDMIAHLRSVLQG